MPALPNERVMTRAMLRRDADYDGVFYVAVRTTGVFCRPSCRARKPRRRNVEFFGSPRAALRAGYRACKRCRPLETDGRPEAWAAQLLARVEGQPARRWRAADLRAIGIDPARASRYFRRHYGMTFAAYQRSRRMGQALAHVRRGENLYEVAAGAGYASNSGFREAFRRVFGAPPARARAAAQAVVSWMPSPLGPLLLGATREGLCLLEFARRRGLEAQVAAVRERLRTVIVPGDNAVLEQARRELAEYFDGARRRFDTPLVLAGTPFQERVWRQLLEIPYGQTRSYNDLARDIGRPGAQRAVGRANGQNRIAIVVPCHRVIRAGGELGGYGGQVWRKQWLLELERRTT